MGKRVLLVEDDSDDCELFMEFFSRREDIKLLPPVNNGMEMVEYLKSIDNDDDLPQLIVLDQNMPKMSGKQALVFLKSNARYAEIPAVIYSTYADATLVADCKKLGAEVVASKPIDYAGYQEMMDNFLQIFKTVL